MRTEDRLSAKQIAARLGLTRLAVIGALYRRDKPPPVKQPRDYQRSPACSETIRHDNLNPIWPATPKPVMTASNIIRLPKPEHALPPPIEALAPRGKPGKATILVRQNGQMHANDHLHAECCRWPIGDPRRPEFHFCGKAPTVPLKPYCETHLAQSVQKIRGTANEPLTDARSVRKSPVLEPT